MPNTQSAKKALRNSEKKRGFNIVRKFKIKNAIKDLKRVLSTNPSEYQTNLSRVFSSLDKAVKGKLIKKNNADRRKSRFAALVNKTLGFKKD
jgi:small subunit ribosomal protein S20